MREKNEISEIHFSQLERTRRIDSDFYSKQNLILQDSFNATACPLTRYADISDGNHLAISEHFCEDGIPYYRGQDIHNFFIENSNPVCIDEDTYRCVNMERSYLQRDDVLLSIVGTIGCVSLVSSDRRATCSCKLAILRPKGKMGGEFLAAYLNSSFGQRQIRRLTRGTVQMGLILEDMDQIMIHDFSDCFMEKISGVIAEAYAIQGMSINLFSESEQILLRKLGLVNWHPTKESISTKSFANVRKTGRMDAEYFQPKYDELFYAMNKIETFHLGSIVSIRKSIEPGSEAYQDSGIPFIRVSDISKYGITTPEVYLDRNTYNSKDLFVKKDSILLSKDGSVGIAYKAEEDLDVITSGALLHLTIKDKSFLPDYLTLVLNSNIVKLQAERDAGGSIIQHWRLSEIEKVIIPKLPANIQQMLATKVQKSFVLRKKSKRLLDLAKHAIEVAVEQSEAVAMNFLEDEQNA